MILEEKQSITLADNALLESEHDFLEDYTIFCRRGKVQNYSQFLHCAPKAFLQRNEKGKIKK